MTVDVNRKKYKKFKFNKENASKKKHNPTSLRDSLKKLQDHFNDKYHSK